MIHSPSRRHNRTCTGRSVIIKLLEQTHDHLEEGFELLKHSTCIPGIESRSNSLGYVVDQVASFKNHRHHINNHYSIQSSIFSK